MTNKIMLKALELAGYENASQLVEVCSATPNPTVAVEMLLDIYEKPDVENNPRWFKSSSSYYSDVYQLVVIDELNDKVMLTKYSPNTKRVWYKTAEDKKNKVYSEERIENCYDNEHILAYTGSTKSTASAKVNDLGASLVDITIDEFTTALIGFSPLVIEDTESELLQSVNNMAF